MHLYRQYIKVLIGSIALIMCMFLLYAYYFSIHFPLPITERISFDAKVKFVRDNIDIDSVDTMIIGSSIGLNNIQGEILQKKSTKINSVINFSVYEATALEAEQLLQLHQTFPNLKRIIYSAQYSDFSHLYHYKKIDPDILIDYMKHQLNLWQEWLIFFHACSNVPFCIHRQLEWSKKHMQANKFEYLGFDKTGSVPLHIYGKDIISHRWRLPQPGIIPEESLGAVYRMAESAKNRNIHFYFVHQPYRQPLYEKYSKVRESMDYVDSRIEQIMQKTDGKLFVLQTLHLDDRFFADRTHLNDKGSIIVSQFIAKEIDAFELEHIKGKK